MDSAKLIDLIRDMAIEPGRNEKAKILNEIIADDLGKWVVEVTYDPFKTWGIKPPVLDKIEGGLNSVSFRRNLIEPILKSLAKRELTGNFAQIEVFEVFQALDNNGRDLLWRILSKDLKAGIGDATIQMVAPGLIPSFAVMRAHTYEEKIVKTWPRKGEYKLDGQRNTFLCKDGSGAFFTRSGKPVPALDFFVPTLLWLAKEVPKHDRELEHVLWDDNDEPAFMLDGEAMMGLFEETGALRRKDVDAKGAELHLYDMMPYREFDAVGSVGSPLHMRRLGLERFVRIAKKLIRQSEHPDMIHIVPQYFLNSHEDVMNFFAQARSKTLASYLARGNAERERHLLKTTIDKATGKPKVLEGIMVKDPDGLYDKKKSRGWLKLKSEETEDLRIIGAFPGEPGTKYENCLGGLIVDRNGVQVRVGGGFSDVERDALWKDWLVDRNMFDCLRIHDADRGSGHTITVSENHPKTVLVNRLIEVEFHEVTPDGSLRHPRFVRFRDDKDGELESKETAA